jgi:hypothetical protein
MLKPLTFGVSLAVALGACSLGFAGGHGKSLPSAQGIAPSAQAVAASPQGYDGGCGVTDACGPVEKKSCLSGLFKHKEPVYETEWVLKKKRVWTFKTPVLFSGHKGLGGLLGHGGGAGGCDACGGDIITPSAQGIAPSAQTYGSGQAFSYGSGQIAPASQIAPAGQIDAVPAPEAAPAPPAAANPATASNGLLFLSPAGN